LQPAFVSYCLQIGVVPGINTVIQGVYLDCHFTSLEKRKVRHVLFVLDFSTEQIEMRLVFLELSNRLFVKRDFN